MGRIMKLFSSRNIICANVDNCRPNVAASNYVNPTKHFCIKKVCYHKFSIKMSDSCIRFSTVPRAESMYSSSLSMLISPNDDDDDDDDDDDTLFRCDIPL